MAEERVRSDLELESVSAGVPAGALDDSFERLVLGIRRREGPEVVSADEHRRGRLQLVHLERRGMPERAAYLERRALAAAPKPVAVRARSRREAGVEAGGRLLRARDRDILGKRGV